MVPMSKAVLLLAGVAVGVLGTLGIRYALGDSDAGRSSPLQAEVNKLRAAQEVAERNLQAAQARGDVLKAETERQQAQLEKLNRDFAKLTETMGAKAPAAPEAPSDTAAKEGPPPTDDEIMKGVGKFGASLQAVILGGGEDAKKEIRDLLARAGEHGIELLVAKFDDDSVDFQMRAVIAHALAQSGDPKAIAKLKAVLADPESGMLEMRLASHSLAFSDAEGLDDTLLAVAHKATDTGARANAAFGLARRNNPEGVELYAKATDEAMANRDPAGLQYLYGFMLLGDAGLPPMRERLLTYTEPQALLMLIEGLKTKGDKGAIENLKKLAADPGRPESVRKSAEGALKVLEAPQ